MRRIVIRGATDLVVEDAPAPEPGPGEVLLRIAYAGICGSDLHYYADGANGAFTVREPLVPGHEVSAVVEHDPSGTWSAGAPVTVHPATFGDPHTGPAGAPHLWPGGAYLGSASTWPHTQGGMAELLVVRADMLRPLPPELPLSRAALAEPLAVGLHAAGLAGDLTGRCVLVSGSGPIGLLAVAAARARGAAHVTSTDTRPAALDRASAVGADGTVLIGRDEVPAGIADVVLECSGAPAAISAGIVAARARGTLVQVGMMPNTPQPVLLAPAISKELTIRGSFRMHDELGEAVRVLAADDRAAAVVTHTFALGDAVEAFGTAGDADLSGKVLMELGG
ncbi:zinc-binding dehydrogenase [Pseudonocardia nematodicida]|uniref:Zinc-binding dehydrogenase n=1 Tax=Pseudonocardia nematodicida TaxID=1206997 RepID=A0ABV1KGH2_9PSEU